MHPLARRIALLFSAFSLVIGSFLLAFNIGVISASAVSTALNLWPLLLVLGGFILVADSTRKRMSAHTAHRSTTEYALPFDAGSGELAVRLQFSYGNLLAASVGTAPTLVVESFDTRPAPIIRHEASGDRSEVSIAVNLPLFPSHVKMDSTWRLNLPEKVPLRLSLQLHEADMRLDLRRLSVESLDLRADSGKQVVLLGPPRNKLNSQIYCSGSHLSLVLPAQCFALVRLLNPFCRVDFPQGDLEKREDGSLITPRAAESKGRVEIDVDGPIRNLVLDIGESEGASNGGET